jgi:hypothetical protein
MNTSSWKLSTEQDICSTAHGLVDHLKSQIKDATGRRWTDQNFDALRSFAQQIDPTLSCFHKPRLDHEEDRHEFLWDFIASVPGQGIVLAAESEQESSTANKFVDLCHDFEKLLYVFAPLRVLITKATSEKHAEELAGKLAQYANGCCQNFNPGSAFILHFCLISGASLVSFIWQSKGSPASVKSEPIRFGKPG